MFKPVDQHWCGITCFEVCGLIYRWFHFDVLKKNLFLINIYLKLTEDIYSH